MRILLLSHAFNSLTQRLYVELRELGHEMSVEFDVNDVVTLQAVELFQPDILIAPFLKRAIPEAVWRHFTCLIVHPGIPGDRGPSALDWAVLNDEVKWGVTVLQANAEMDAGDIWASSEFVMREASKGSLYRNEVIEAALRAVLSAIDSTASGDIQPRALNYADPEIRGQLRPLMKQTHRSIDWQKDNSKTVLRKIHSADGVPGVADRILGRCYYLYDAQMENTLTGKAGELIARCGGAVCRATRDGAVWIGHLRDRQGEPPIKLPAMHLLCKQLEHLPEITPGPLSGYRDIWYERQGRVGYLHFPFYNGAMGTQQCERLRQAFIAARQQDTRVIVLMGGGDYWSNGMHLNLIEAADSAADESWRNINAIDDLALEIINTPSQITIAALQGNTGAGGVFLARAADRVWARRGVILNPHYKDMGNLYGSEYWSYLLPRYAGAENARRIVESRLPMGAIEGQELGLIDETFEPETKAFVAAVENKASLIASDPEYGTLLAQKIKRRQRDENQKPLQAYRDEELEKMRFNFYGFDPSYHVARYNFVYKIPKSRTPLTIAQHRRTHEAVQGGV